MKIVDLMSRLRRANVTVRADGDSLAFSAPPGALGPELRAALAEHKSEVLEFLRRSAAPGRTAPAVRPVPRDRPLPLSFAQQRIWFFEQVQPGTPTYHMAAAWRLRGDLDVPALQRAFTAVTQRHEILRTRFTLEGGDPVQSALARVSIPLPVIDLAPLAEPDRDAEIRRLMAADYARPFDLTEPPLIRTTVLRTDAGEHILMLTMHHIIADMWSTDVILRELMRFYRPGGHPAPSGGAVDQEPPAVQYADFAVAQREWPAADAAAGLDYWQRRLAGAPTVLELPTDRPYPAQRTHSGGQRSEVLPAELVAKLDALCRRAGVTRFMLLLTAFHILLTRYSGEPDVLVGTPIANRTRSEVENLIGPFLNILVLRGDLTDDPTVSEALRRTRATTLDAFEHPDVPVEQLVEVLRPVRETGRPPLFQAMFTLQNTASTPLALPGLTAEALPDRRAATDFDLTLEVTDADGVVRTGFHYNRDVFDADTVDRMLASLHSLLHGLAEDPERRVSTVPMVTGPELERLVRTWNATDRDHEPVTVPELITGQAARTPDAPAVVFRERRMTYAELDAASDALAARLRELGAGRGRPVAVGVERSPELLVGLLGVLKSGAAYLPVDTTLATERLAYMLDDAGVELIVTSRAQRHRFEGRSARLVDVGGLASAGPRPGGQAGPADPGDLAYVIYTSGSTGRPKGVMVEHRNLTGFLAAMDDVLDGSVPGKWLALTSVSFDIAALELLWPLTHGWPVVLQDEGDVLPGGVARRPRGSRTLDFSLFYFSAGDDPAAGRDGYHLLLEGARFADRHGFLAVWTPERHFAEFGGLYPNPAVTAAALAAVTERIQLRAGSVVLPLHNPIRVAEEWAVVDNLSAGRVGLSFASGWHADDFALAPDPGVYPRRKEAMLEQIETVRRLWRGEPVDARNGVGRTVQLGTHPRPVQDELPVWLTAAGNPDTFRMAGERGAGLLTHLLGQSVAELAEKIAVYRGAWRAAGHPGEGHVTLMVHTYVGDDPATVREKVRGPFREYLRTSFGLVQALAPSLGYDSEPTAEDVEALLDHAFEIYYDGSALIGTVEDCTVLAERLRDSGVDEVACLVDFGVAADDVLQSLPLLDEVRRRCADPVPAAEADYGIAAQIDRHGVTHVQCTPSLAAILMADPATRRALGDVDTLLVGGESLPRPLAADLAGTVRRGLINMYGPTETTIWSTCGRVERSADRVSIGRPIANTQVYILDTAFQPVPVGVPGELFIGGVGVARGYLHRPQLTAERFPASPFTTGRRMYRTGDRARYLPDGRIEFLGRVDRQVKIGGHRLELGEIESVLLEHPSIRQAAVTLRTDPDGHPYLAAYLVGSGEPLSPAQVRDWLAPKLPEVAIPAAVLWPAALPLSPSGKIDYRSLPDPDSVPGAWSARTTVTAREYVAPRDDLERTVADVFKAVLKVDRVGMRDGFFELGGHSLMAIQLVSRLRAELDTDVTLRAVFESSTVAELADRIREVEGAPRLPARPALLPVPRGAVVPLSFAQQRMWFFDQMNPDTTAYHLAAALRFDIAVRPSLLRRAFEEIVRRHEILRTDFAVVDGTPGQVINAARRIPLPLVDLSGLADADREEVTLALAHDEARNRFDLEHGPLLRTTLLRLRAAEHVLLVSTHHIVSDSWSIGVLVRELGLCYDAYAAGVPAALPDLPVQYADYTIWQTDWLRGPVLDRQLDFWRASLAGAPPVLALPGDRPRPPVPSHQGAQTSFQLGPELTDGLKALSLEHEVTVFVTLLTAFSVLLRLWCHEDHIVLGVPVSGRDAPEVEPLIGAFANTTVIHSDLGGDPRFTEALAGMRDRVVDAYDHQDLPVEKLVADLGVPRNLSYNPLFQVMFVYINDLTMLPTLGGVEATPLEVHQGQVFMDLNLAMEDGPDGLRGTVDYSTDLFDPATIEWLLASFKVVLSAVVARPDARIDSLALADGAPLGDGASLGETAPPADDALPADGVLPADDAPPADGALVAEPGALRVVVSSTFTADPVEEALSFWLAQMGFAAEVEFAPYSQVFQQLLDPGSTMAGNREGFNVVILRMEDWQASEAEVADEFVRAVAAFVAGRTVPLVVALCPSGAEGAAAWRARIAAGLAGLDGVACLDMTPMLDRYGIREFDDPFGLEAGNVPYTPEFFAVLGTCLARQMAALDGAHPDVFVIDGDAVRTSLDPAAAGAMTAAARALSRRGRSVYVIAASPLTRSESAAWTATGATVWADERPLPEMLDAVAKDSGVDFSRCAFLTAHQAACLAVQDARAEVTALRHPTSEPELDSFLEHTWLFDSPGGAISGPGWWKEPR